MCERVRESISIGSEIALLREIGQRKKCLEYCKSLKYSGNNNIAIIALCT